MQGISQYSVKHIAALEKVVVQRFGLSRGELRTKSRIGANARHVMFYLLNKHFMYSSTQIGRLYNRDHSTVLNGVRKIQSNKAVSTQSDDIFLECLRNGDNSGDIGVDGQRYNLGTSVEQEQANEDSIGVIPTTVHRLSELPQPKIILKNVRSKPYIQKKPKKP